MEKFTLVYNSPNCTMIFLSCLNKKGRNSRFSCVTLPDENISRCFPRLSFFRAWSSKCSFLSVLFNMFHIESCEIHGDRTCCQKSDKLLQISFKICCYTHYSLIFLVLSSSDHRQLLCCFPAFIFHRCFQHTSFVLHSAAHTEAFRAAQCKNTMFGLR